MKVFVGTDVEHVDRFKSMLNSKVKMLRIFTESEYNYAIKKLLQNNLLLGYGVPKSRL